MDVGISDTPGGTEHQLSPLVLSGMVSIHAEETASLCETRMVQQSLPHVDVDALARLDRRLMAHLDGLAVARAPMHIFLGAAPEAMSSGAAFAATVVAIEQGQAGLLEPLWSLADASQGVRDGMTAAFGWVERRHLQGMVRDLLRSADPMKRAIALGACARHRVDPGLESGPWLEDPVAQVRAKALGLVGKLGLRNLAPGSESMTSDDEDVCCFWAATSAVLLGSRGAALGTLTRIGLEDGPHRSAAFRLAFQAMSLSETHASLHSLAREGHNLACLIQGTGISGDPAYIPWLVSHMSNPTAARVAGEAFTLITGADLDALQLWCFHPEGFESGVNDDPEDPNVDMDPDEGLAWPDQAKVQAWWDKNASRFQPGTRYFMGAPVTREHCIEVLKNGYQRQRVLAAHYLCLLEPGTPLFNTSAPAWRQQKLLAQMA